MSENKISGINIRLKIMKTNPTRKYTHYISINSIAIELDAFRSLRMSENKISGINIRLKIMKARNHVVSLTRN